MDTEIGEIRAVWHALLFYGVRFLSRLHGTVVNDFPLAPGQHFSFSLRPIAEGRYRIGLRLGYTYSAGGSPLIPTPSVSVEVRSGAQVLLSGEYKRSGMATRTLRSGTMHDRYHRSTRGLVFLPPHANAGAEVRGVLNPQGWGPHITEAALVVTVHPS